MAKLRLGWTGAQWELLGGVGLGMEKVGWWELLLLWEGGWGCEAGLIPK
jgi:hypothetical protein